MPSIDSKKLVDEIIAADGYYGDDPRVIIIVQYITQMGTTCYYLCYKWDDLVYTANVAEPKILWIANAGRLGQ